MTIFIFEKDSTSLLTGFLTLYHRRVRLTRGLYLLAHWIPDFVPQESQIYKRRTLPLLLTGFLYLCHRRVKLIREALYLLLLTRVLTLYHRRVKLAREGLYLILLTGVMTLYQKRGKLIRGLYHFLLIGFLTLYHRRDKLIKKGLYLLLLTEFLTLYHRTVKLIRKGLYHLLLTGVLTLYYRRVKLITEEKDLTSSCALESRLCTTAVKLIREGLYLLLLTGVLTWSPRRWESGRLSSLWFWFEHLGVELGIGQRQDYVETVMWVIYYNSFYQLCQAEKSLVKWLLNVGNWIHLSVANASYIARYLVVTHVSHIVK